MSKNYFLKDKKQLARTSDSFSEVFQNEKDISSKSVNLPSTSASQSEQFRKNLKSNASDQSARDKFVLWSDEEISPFRNKVQPHKNTNEGEENTEQNKVDINTLLNGEVMQTCPICCKKNTFVQNDAFIVHLKSCASKNNLSTDQLIRAIELHQKQTSERRALGLPRVKEKPTVKRQAVRKGGTDTNLEYAIALSTSLQESERRNRMCETEILFEAGLETEACSQYRKLEDFGFSAPTNNASSSSRNVRKQKNLRNTLLFTRSQSERVRIITEKISIILVDPVSPSESILPYQGHELRSKFLKKYRDSNSTLWEKSHHLEEQCDDDFYYCKNLSAFISPCDMPAGAKLKHVSQIPYRLPSPGKTMIKESSLSELAALYFQQEPKIIPKKEAPSVTSCVASKTSEYQELSRAWKTLINKSTMSDVTIYAKNERAIYAHKLVLFARCPAILTEAIKECENGKTTEMLMWMNYDYETIIVFLEYLYCGDLAGVNKLSEKQRADLKALSSSYDVYVVKQAIDKLNQMEEEPIIIDSDHDDDIDNENSVKVEITEGERNLRLLELELDAQSVHSSPIGSPEMFVNIDDESSLEELQLSSSLEEIKSSKCYSNKIDIPEKRKICSPVEENSVKKLKFEEDTPSDLEIDFNTPTFSPKSIAYTVSDSSDPQPCWKEQKKEKIETIADEDFNSTPDVLDQDEDVCVLETSPYISPVWDGFEDMNYAMESCAPPIDFIKSVERPKTDKKDRRSNDPFFDSFDINTSEFDRLVEKETARTQPVLASAHISPNITPVSVRKLKCRSKSDDVLTPVSKVTSDVTPLADYSHMKTKDLKKELDRYGLKPGINRNKAKKLLRFIYDQLHPYEDDSRQSSTVTSKLETSNSTSESRNRNKFSFEDKENDSDEGSTQSSGIEFLEESFAEEETEMSQDVKDKSHTNRVTLDVGFRKLIEQDKDLHQKILLYEPVWLETLRSSLKELNVKFSLNELVNYLDEQCITYRTLQTRNRRRRKKKCAATGTQIAAR